MKPIVVINPNSTEAVTVGIDRSIAPLRMPSGPPIECITLKEGPPGIESQETSDSVIMPLCRLIRSRDGKRAHSSSLVSVTLDCTPLAR